MSREVFLCPTHYPKQEHLMCLIFSGFRKKEQRDVLDAMLNNENNDYSTVDELAKSDRLSQYSYEVIGDAVEYLTGRGFFSIRSRSLTGVSMR